MVPGVVSRIKIMCELDISERRLPQDGRVGLTIDGKQIDIRVVTLPTVHGESAVMRILDRSNALIEIPRSGSTISRGARLRSATGHAHGSVLVTGPTGSGKSTTLYAALNSLNTPDKNIITDRGSGRVPAGGRHPGRRQRALGPDVRQRAALDDARGPRHHHGRRDPRPRDGADQHRGCAHRPPGAVHAAHQRRAQLHHAARRDGDRAVPGRLLGPLRGRAASGARAVHGMQAARDARGAACWPRPALPPTHDIDGYEAGRLPAVRRRRLPGPRRHLRDHADHRRDPRARRCTAPPRTGSWTPRGPRACARCARTPSRRSAGRHLASTR